VTPRRETRIGLYGGSFDPIHVGHIAVAKAAMRRFGLDQIHFIPTGRPPLKRVPCRASYADRYAMVALACAGESRFVASLAEAGADQSGRQVFYSVDTVRSFRQKFPSSQARLFFLMGADSFLQIEEWKDYRILLGLCDFVVASRPGFSMSVLREVVPPDLLAPASRQGTPKPNTVALRRTTIYALNSLKCPISATEVRRRVAANAPIRGLVPLRVEEYITKQALYR
jgi:nicotinate-nucleotide adenylyltransferase